LERALYEGACLTHLGGRAFDVLVELVRHAGSVVTWRELTATVWRDTVVEEVNLRVHIASLRRALGDGRDGRRFIATSVGHGYTFVAPVTRVRPSDQAPAPPQPHHEQSLLAKPGRTIGREHLEADIANAVSRHTLVTLVGPGGIGKTCLAIAVANRIASKYLNGAIFVDLAGISRDEHIFSGFASSLGMRAVSSAAELGILLAEREMLVVLDNCEHVIDAAASAVGEVLRRAPRLRIIATSREVLRTEGEWVCRIPSLEVPPPGAAYTAAEALEFSSVELFVERAASDGDPYHLTDADAPLASEICRRLDGIPLAIELAASRADALGVAGLNAALQTHLGFALRGPRSAPPRHRTLHAMFDWSYETLSPSERRTLRALSVFRGPFTLEGAPALATDNEAERPSIYGDIARLVEKSMVTADAHEDDVRFRLLEITREYAAEQLRSSGEAEIVARRHASYHRTVCAQAEAQLVLRPAADWIAAHRWRIDDVRAALSWAFGPSGDTVVGVALTVASIALWFEVCSLEEYRRYVERALAFLRNDRSGAAAESEVKLSLALGIMILHTIGPVPAMTEAIAAGLRVAETLSPALHMQAIGAMWVDGIARADYSAVLTLAERFSALARATGEPGALLMGERLMASARHFHGRLTEGLRHAERFLSAAGQHRLVYSTPLQVDGRVTMRTLVSRTLWLTGYPEMAACEARRCVELAVELRHVGALCYILALGACPIAFWSGDAREAERYVAQLIEAASRASFGFWVAWGRAYERASKLPARHGLRAKDLGLGAKQCDHLVTIRPELLDDATEARADSGVIGWCAAEVRRAKAARASSVGKVSEAERLLREGLNMARRQGALGWELRIATDLARIQRDRGDTANARRLLAETTSRFTEGEATMDRRAASALLASL
jgi:predicted ATPase/DNA-binding winged helix-turn-helix (wHTH) protein